MDDLIKSVKLNGIAKKEHWLSVTDEEKVRQIIRLIHSTKGEKKSWIAVNFKALIIKFLKLDYKSIIRSFFLLKLAKKLQLKKIAEKIFENKVKLSGIDCYYNPKSEEPVLDWHVDNAYSGSKNVKNFINPEKNAIKFFFYLTDASTDNGCLSYIPKSNRIAYALKKGIFEKAINYTPYWSLSDFRKTIQIKDNYDYIKNIVGENMLSEFLKTTSFIEKKNSVNHIFDNEMKKGGAIIFDEAGVHRGSKTRLNERMVLRFFYNKII